MPIYEFRCESCSHEFEELVLGSESLACPSCEGTRLERLVSGFAVRQGGLPPGAEAAAALRPFAGGGPGACGTCGSPDGPGSCSP